jgi:hypothetical protein
MTKKTEQAISLPVAVPAICVDVNAAADALEAMLNRFQGAAQVLAALKDIGSIDNALKERQAAIATLDAKLSRLNDELDGALVAQDELSVITKTERAEADAYVANAKAQANSDAAAIKLAAEAYAGTIDGEARVNAAKFADQIKADRAAHAAAMSAEAEKLAQLTSECEAKTKQIAGLDKQLAAIRAKLEG